MKRYCRNCFHPLPYKAKFCAHCGQKDTDGRIGMKSLMTRLWNNTFHLEGKFIRTAWQLFVPGKVSVEFFKGKQERYPHPIRLFAIVMFLFLFFLNSFLKVGERFGREMAVSEGDAVEVNLSDSLKNNGIPFTKYERMQHLMLLYDLREKYETLPANWKTREAEASVDSLMRFYGKRYNLGAESWLDSLDQQSFDTTSIGLFGNTRFATFDLARYDADELIRRYDVKEWYNQLFLRQTIKSYKNPDLLVHAMIGSLTWAILALVGIMSGFLALLYFRQKRYYVEHFIFLLHFHTGAMLLLLLALIGERVGLWAEGTVVGLSLLPIPGIYLGLLRFYGQGWFKTFVKWCLYCFFYLVAFLLLFILGAIVVFAVF